MIVSEFMKFNVQSFRLTFADYHLHWKCPGEQTINFFWSMNQENPLPFLSVCFMLYHKPMHYLYWWQKCFLTWTVFRLLWQFSTWYHLSKIWSNFVLLDGWSVLWWRLPSDMPMITSEFVRSCERRKRASKGFLSSECRWNSTNLLCTILAQVSDKIQIYRLRRCTFFYHVKLLQMVHYWCKKKKVAYG